MKYLYTNGCSFTEGVDLENPLKERWSKRLSENLSLKGINEGLGGGSNQRIMRKTIDWIVSNPNKIRETLFVIQVTYPSRYETYDENKDTFERENWTGLNSYEDITFRYILYLHSLLSRYKIKHLFFDIDLEILKTLLLSPYGKFCYNSNFYTDKTMLQYCKYEINHADVTNAPHPNKKCCEGWANILTKYIKDNIYV